MLIAAYSARAPTEGGRAACACGSASLLYGLWGSVLVAGAAAAAMTLPAAQGSHRHRAGQLGLLALHDAFVTASEPPPNSNWTRPRPRANKALDYYADRCSPARSCGKTSVRPRRR